MNFNKKLFFLLLLVTFKVHAQNLVLNPGLENYISCPGFGQFGNTWVNDWFKPGWGSSDYYHTACPAILPPLPGPHSGNGEAGIILFNYGTEYREYITAGLSAPLQAGQQYDVEFYISLNSGYIHAVQETGAYLSDSVPGPYLNALTINVIPQVKNNNGFLSYGWQKVSGTITAAGGESFITIGNFSNDSNTTTLQVGTTGSYGSYYFIDDVYVGRADSVPSGISNISNGHAAILPAIVNATGSFQAYIPDNKVVQLDLYEVNGSKIRSIILTPGQSLISLNRETAGLYFYTLHEKENMYSRGKLFIIR